jgi:hypothetical protein
MKIVITESQYNKIISEGMLDSLKNVFTGKTMINLVSAPEEFQMEFKLPKVSSSDDFMKKLGNSPIKFSAFHIENEGYKFPIFPLSLTGNYKGNTYRFSMEPLNKERGFNMVNLKITLDGKEKKTPKEI